MTAKIFIQDSGVYIPTDSLTQSFSVINFEGRDSGGIGTDNVSPEVNFENPNLISDVFIQDYFGGTAEGDIYRLSKVGIGNDTPEFDLDVTGTVRVTGNVIFEAELDVTGPTILRDTLQVDGATTLNDTLLVEGESDFNSAVRANSTLDVLDETTLNSTLTVEGESDFNSAVRVNSTLDVSDRAIFTADIQSDDINTGTVVVVGGVGLSRNLNVGENTVLTGTLELQSSLIDVNDSTSGPGLGQTDYRLSSVGSGVSWRPSGVETFNTIWVTENGVDSNSGLLEGDAKRTIGAAAEAAQEGDTILVKPGIYSENNPIGLRSDVSLSGTDLRLVTIVPQNIGEDVFYVRRGCLIENINFAGNNPLLSYEGAAAVAFPPTPDKNRPPNSGFLAPGPALPGETGRWRSPYVRNCTNFMKESIGMKIDGSDAGGTEVGNDLKSMVCDSFTQYNENGIGVSLTNDAYAQLVSIFTINNDISIFATSGGQCDLTNSNSSFGNFGLVAVGLGSTQFTGEVQQDALAGDDTTVLNDVVDLLQYQYLAGDPRTPFDGQALWFDIDLANYPGPETGRIGQPLREVIGFNVINGGTGFSQADPPPVIIRDAADESITPKGPQGIPAEATATVNAEGVITDITLTASGRNYLASQNLEVDIEGDSTVEVEVITGPIYFTVAQATRVTPIGSPQPGISTVTYNEFLTYDVFAGDPINLQRISRILTSSHSFEYIGTGTDINTSVPFAGPRPIKANEIVALDGAQVPFTSTDQQGNFDIGEGLQIDQTTSTIRGRDFSRAIQAEVTPLILALR